MMGGLDGSNVTIIDGNLKAPSGLAVDQQNLMLYYFDVASPTSHVLWKVFMSRAVIIPRVAFISRVSKHVSRVSKYTRAWS